MKKMKVNGEDFIAENSVTISELISVKKIQSPDMVSVQLNGNFIDRSEYSNTALKEGDEIDFLYFMGGGGF